jgi:hypothetical protein
VIRLLVECLNVSRVEPSERATEPFEVSRAAFWEIQARKTLTLQRVFGSICGWQSACSRDVCRPCSQEKSKTRNAEPFYRLCLNLS